MFNERTAMIKEVLLCLCLALAPVWTAPVQTGKYIILLYCFLNNIKNDALK